MTRSRFNIWALIIGASIIVLSSYPLVANAVLREADAMCTAGNYTCPFGSPPPPGQAGPCMLNKPCQDKTSNFTTGGSCIQVQVCLAKTTSGMNGFGLDQVARILGDLMGKLMQGGQGGQGGQQPPPSTGGGFTQPATPPSCSITSTTVSSNASSTVIQLTWSTTGDVSSASITPNIGIVTPNGSQTITTANATPYSMTVSGPGGSNYCSTTAIGLSGGTGGNSLSDLLFGNSNTNTNTNTNANTGDDDTPTPTSNILNQITNTTNPNPNTNTNTNANTQATATVPVFSNPAFLIPGLRGDIQLINSGGTVIVGSRDQGRNTEVAGFYGSYSTIGGQPQGIVAGICRNRPWAGNFLSAVLPANFFDGLCVARGYQVGNPAPVQTTPGVTVTQTTPKPIPTATTTAPKPTATSSIPSVPPKVRIWAVPSAVPLGSRSTIFWTSQGVTTCLVKSPDGSFSQTALSGGASTVSLTGATTFSISCLAPDGTPVTDFVTVNLAI